MVSGLQAPFSFNFTQNTGLFAASTDKSQCVLFDYNKPFRLFGNWNENLVISRYKMPTNQIQNGCWWEQTSLHNRPSTLEGGYLYHYKGTTKLFVIQIFKASMNDNSSFIDECKMVYDLAEIISADTGYINNADIDDTMVNLRQSMIITAIAWRDDIVLIGHGYGNLTILKSRVNVGGMAFQYIRTLEMDSIENCIIDITIFDDRRCAVTSDDGVFAYCKI